MKSVNPARVRARSMLWQDRRSCKSRSRPAGAIRFGMAPCALLLASLLFASDGVLADFQEGVAAYYRGDYDTAYREWLPLAEQGHAGAQFNLGALYADGHVDPRDDSAAAKWFRLAAEQGSAQAQFALGKLYRQGRGVPQDDEEAVKWYRLAAEQGHVEAQAVLGAMYAQGYGVSRDLVKAYAWFQLSGGMGYEPGRNLKAIVEKMMTPLQIKEAQKLSMELFKQQQR